MAVVGSCACRSLVPAGAQGLAKRAQFGMHDGGTHARWRDSCRGRRGTTDPATRANQLGYMQHKQVKIHGLPRKVQVVVCACECSYRCRPRCCIELHNASGMCTQAKGSFATVVGIIDSPYDDSTYVKERPAAHVSRHVAFRWHCRRHIRRLAGCLPREPGQGARSARPLRAAHRH